MKRYFSKKQLADIRAKAATIGKKTDNLVIQFTHYPFTNAKAREYAQQGFARRVQTLHRCIENVFKLIPPGTIKLPSKARLYDAQINIQAFIANVYGSIDNLAWIWVYERKMANNIKRERVGLGKQNTQVRNSLSEELRTYLESMQEWFDWITDYRHALAHRIPLYIPPGMVLQKDVDAYNEFSTKITEALNRLRPDEFARLMAEQAKLLIFQPLIAHSTTETKAPFVFHAQLIADFLTVEALAEKMMIELRRAHRV